LASDSSRPEFWDTRYRGGVTPWDAGRAVKLFAERGDDVLGIDFSDAALAGFFFFGDNERGPPFGISQRELDPLLRTAFEREEDEAVPPGQSVPVLSGRERWQGWRRRL
jgi:hypothetical protein